jgi:hypothetical protein
VIRACVVALFLLLGFGAQAEQLPSGNWQASCKTFRQVHGVLFALCQRPDGRWAKTSLDHADGCQVAAYVDGALRCLETRAQAAANQPTFAACYQRCLRTYNCQAGVHRAANDISCSHDYAPSCRQTCRGNARSFTGP